MSTQTTRPTVPWAGILFGTLFALAAGAGILLLARPDMLEAVFLGIRPLLFDLRPEWFGALVPLAIGALVIAGGVFFAVRRGERGPSAPDARREAPQVDGPKAGGTHVDVITKAG
ncbi:hypothetical protein [Microbacterium sp. JZ31]|uniref:hypothetical protein n=1 Tax=Microbacterium sp. JZ31 TaxID=1906274 RepID=UPI0019328A94|nr:hypothetical protein [Microbacterium sp. JZ31]